MADNVASDSSPTRPKSGRSTDSKHIDQPTEESPLLPRNISDNDEEEEEEEADYPQTRAESSLLWALSRPATSKWKKTRRWSTVLCLLMLCSIMIVIIVLGFFDPEVLRGYVDEAMVAESTSASLESFSDNGVSVRLMADIKMDASQVRKKSVRYVGRFTTWIMREVGCGPASVRLYLPDYNMTEVVGVAEIPAIRFNVVSGHTTHIDTVADFKPRSSHEIQAILDDWLEGKLVQLRVNGKAEVPLRSGAFKLGLQNVEKDIIFQGNDLPTFPDYSISNFQVHEVDLPEDLKGVGAEVALTIPNKYLLDVTIPPLAFNFLVGNCLRSDPYIPVANAFMNELQIHSSENIHIKVSGIARKLPHALIQTCSNSKQSPLEMLLLNYIHGEKATIYISGSSSSPSKAPEWIKDLLLSVIVPVPIVRNTSSDFSTELSVEKVHFQLPDPLADPGTPDSHAKISANILASIPIPEGISIPLNVSRFRANVKLYYRGKKLGDLDVSDWQRSNSKLVDGHDDVATVLNIRSALKHVPLQLSDEDLFSKVVQEVMFGTKTLLLGAKADVDIKVESLLGIFTLKKIPAEGVIPVKPILGHIAAIKPSIRDLQVLDTGDGSLTLQSRINFANPTDYTADIPYFNVNLSRNGTILGNATVENFSVVGGDNRDLILRVTWDPQVLGGKKGQAIGKNMLSQYISGFNTRIILVTHEKSLPAQPALGKALARLQIEVPIPKIGSREDPDGESPFIEDATMHLFSSTADFTLMSPFSSQAFTITKLNATAFYTPNRQPDPGDAVEYGQKPYPVGHIEYDCPFDVPPDHSRTPRLPVDWHLGDKGVEMVKKALGGRLTLSARADVSVRIGQWEQDVWFVGSALGTNIRL